MTFAEKLSERPIVLDCKTCDESLIMHHSKTQSILEREKWNYGRHVNVMSHLCACNVKCKEKKDNGREINSFFTAILGKDCLSHSKAKFIKTVFTNCSYRRVGL